MSERTVVIVSPYFPPSTLAGVHRARHLAKHLPEHGWTPIVLCVDEAFHEQQLDPELVRLVPDAVEIVKVPAMPARMTRLLGIGEISLRAWRPLRQALLQLLRSRSVDAVLITGSPFYPMLLAGMIKRRFGVPVVLDFQDPWVSDWGAAQHPFSKAGAAHRLALLLEPRALRHADFVTSVSDTQNAEMASRYPWLDSSQMAGIPIGGDPEDFEALRARPLAGDVIELDPSVVNCSYVGTFLPRSAALVRTLFRSLQRLRAAKPDVGGFIRFNFIGTSNQPNDRSTYRVRPLAEAEGVADAVREIPQRLPYLQALGVLARSDAVLMIGSDEPHYTASKIYPGLMSGRPFLSLFHQASSAHEILSAAGGGLTFGFKDNRELAALEQPLADGLKRLATAPESLGRAEPAACAPYESGAIAGRYAAIFERIGRNG